MAEVTGPGPAEMKLLAARLREADPALKRELRRNLKDAASPVVGDVKQSILSMPAKARKGLRAEVAGTVKLSTSFTKNGINVTITSDGKRMPPGKQTLPHHLDSGKGWNHPVWGHGRRSSWAWRHQLGKPEWFEQPVYRRAREFQAAAQQAIDSVQHQLGAG